MPRRGGGGARKPSEACGDGATGGAALARVGKRVFGSWARSQCPAVPSPCWAGFVGGLSAVLESGACGT